jgi:bacterioferritin-associated ferredoxin
MSHGQEGSSTNRGRDLRMILCLCRGISDHTVRAAIGAGAATLDDVAAACAAGSDCGACQRMIVELLTATRQRRESAAMEVAT